jgi:hypothetical protein
MRCNVLAAEYTKGGARGPSTLDLNRIIDGHRTRVVSFNVASKREARQIAKAYMATPWNF